jgi:hypothetical protein
VAGHPRQLEHDRHWVNEALQHSRRHDHVDRVVRLFGQPAADVLGMRMPPVCQQ